VPPGSRVVYIALVAGSQVGYLEQRVFAQRQATNADHGTFAEKQLQQAVDFIESNAPRISTRRRDRSGGVGRGLGLYLRVHPDRPARRRLAPDRLERFQGQIRQRLNKLACEEHKLSAVATGDRGEVVSVTAMGRLLRRW